MPFQRPQAASQFWKDLASGWSFLTRVAELKINGRWQSCTVPWDRLDEVTGLGFSRSPQAIEQIGTTHDSRIVTFLPVLCEARVIHVNAFGGLHERERDARPGNARPVDIALMVRDVDPADRKTPERLRARVRLG